MTGDRADLAARVPDLGGSLVLCVGDVMLDRFVEGEVDRISPEAPVPVLRVTRRSAMLGGAGNVARNVSALGARAILVGLVGEDETADELRALCDADPLVTAELIADPGRPTTIKTRFLAGAQQLLRADEERAVEPSADMEEALLAAVRRGIEAGAQVVVLSDYGKGALSRAVIEGAIAAAGELPVVVDPKGRDCDRYRGATLITPNRAELADATGMPTVSDGEVAAAAAALIRGAGIGNVLATRGAAGMLLLAGEPGAAPEVIPAEAREVFDVSGAGDTVVATVAAAIPLGLPLADCARLANAAAGLAVAKAGTASVTAEELSGALHHEEVRAAEHKLLSRDALVERVAAWRRRGLTVGFTNGCFDLLHPGHIHLIRQARASCDRLVVALNTDASVRRLKGEGRPVQSEAARATVLGSLGDVDAVVLFDEDTPLALIEAVRPDVLVKGADYSRDQVIGAEVVERHGGRVVLAELLDGHSTTGTIARLERSGAY